jgi:hypothetical protein
MYVVIDVHSAANYNAVSAALFRNRKTVAGVEKK